MKKNDSSRLHSITLPNTYIELQINNFSYSINLIHSYAYRCSMTMGTVVGEMLASAVLKVTMEIVN